MRKFYLLAAIALLFGLNASALVDLPYSSKDLPSPSDKIDDDTWSRLNVSGSGATWSTFGTGANGFNSLRIWQAAKATHDKWLISPGFNAVKGHKYKMTYHFKVHAATNEIPNFDIHFTQTSPITSVDAALASSKVPLKERPTTFTEYSAEFTATENGVTYFAFRVYDSITGAPYVSDVKIIDEGEDNAGGDSGEGGEGGDQDDDFVGVVLPYSSGSFTDDMAPKSELNDDGWSYKDYGVAASSWSVATNFPYDKDKYPLRLGANTYYQESDIWLVSPKFKVKEGNEYTLTFYTRSQAALNTSYSFNAYLANVNPVLGEEEKQKVANSKPVEFTEKITTEYIIRTATFKAEESGESYFAIRFEGQHGTPILIADVNITEIGGNGEGGDDEPDVPHDECFATITQLPYASTLTTDGSTWAEGWRVINVEENSKTWKPANESVIPDRFGAIYYYDLNYAADDYLISPSIHLNKGEEYVIQYGYQAHSSDEKIEIVASLNEDMSDPIVIDKQGTVSSYTKSALTFTPKQTGDYYIAYHAISPANKNNIYVGDFLVARKSDRNPKAVTNLTATPADNRELKVTLNWTNPTQDIFDNAVTLTKIEVYRDELAEPIATLEGTPTSYTDTKLAAGEHTYTVIAYAGELASSPTQVKTLWIGPLEAQPVPVTFTINSQDDFNNFTVVSGSNSTVSDTQKWRYNSSYGAQLTGASTSKEDDWLISPPIKVETSGLYKIIVNAKVDNKTYPYQIEIRLGTSYDVNSFDKVVATLTDGMTTSLNDYEYVLNIETAGTYYVAVHGCYAENGRSYAQHYYVKSVGMEKSVALPGIAEEVTVTPDADKQLEATIEWTNPTATNVEGITLNAGDIVKAVVYRDGEAIETVEEAAQLVPGEKGVYVDTEVPAAGDHTYKVEIYSADGCSKTAPTEVTVWVGGGAEIPKEGLSYMGEAFSEWEKVNAAGGYGGWYYSTGGTTFEFYRYATAPAVDDWTISPRLEFEANKLYKVEISSHEYSYGSQDDYKLNVHIGDNADHTELPQVGTEPLVNLVKGAKAENKQVDTFYVKTNVTDEGEAMLMAAADDEDAEANAYVVKPGTHRLALHANYIPEKDVDFYIDEVKLTKIGDTTTGVEDVVSGEGVSVNGDSIVFDGEATVAVYNMAGALVAAETHAKGRFDLSGLGKGVFVVRVTTENGQMATVKVIR